MHAQQSTGATRLIFGQTIRLLPYLCVRTAKALPMRQVPKSHVLAQMTLY